MNIYLPSKFKLINLTILALFFSTFLLIALFVKPNSVLSEDDADEIQKEIDKKRDELSKKENELGNIKSRADEISSKIKSLGGQLNVTKGQVSELEGQIKELSEDIANLNTKMEIKNEEIEHQKVLRNNTLRELYINNQKAWFELLISPDNLIKTIENSAYYKVFVNDTKNNVGTLNVVITNYENDINEIASIKAQIETQKKDLQNILDKLAAQVNTAQSELSAISQKKVALEQERNQIQQKLSELSAKQKALLQEKTETFTTSVGDVPTTGDKASQANYDPGFRKAFALFSFGAPHRKGMSQYGAKGRAESGQNYEQILKGYYGDIKIEKPDLPDDINTDKGSFSLDGKYLYGLAEMPASWPMDALKAQAIAARTYAMSYVGWRSNNTDPSGRICTTENCQVWSSSKVTADSAKRWRQAVDETKGQIMLGKNTDEIFSAWYAASSGGYNYSYNSLGHQTKGGWDTSCGSRDCWTSDAYESKAGSPWFYKGWYKSRSGNSCGRSHPWLKEDEFADIIGALVLYKEDKDNQKHLSQTDAKQCWGEEIDDTWSKEDVKEKSGIEKIDDVKVSYSSSGYTSEVKVTTNKGELKFDGDDFKAIFNLRAPGQIHLTSALFNVEVKK